MNNLSENSVNSLDIKREKFLEEITKRPDVLYEFPIEKLEIINKYYDELLEKKSAELEKLKKAN